MAIRNWHLGQLVVLWVGAALVELLLVGLMESWPRPPMIPVRIVVALLFFGLPCAMLAVTWKWFGTKSTGSPSSISTPSSTLGLNKARTFDLTYEGKPLNWWSVLVVTAFIVAALMIRFAFFEPSRQVRKGGVRFNMPPTDVFGEPPDRIGRALDKLLDAAEQAAARRSLCFAQADNWYKPERWTGDAAVAVKEAKQKAERECNAVYDNETFRVQPFKQRP